MKKGPCFPPLLSSLPRHLTLCPPSLPSFQFLLTAALNAGLSPLAEDTKGRNALYVFCEQLATVPLAEHPTAPELVKMVVQACRHAAPHSGVGGWSPPAAGAAAYSHSHSHGQGQGQGQGRVNIGGADRFGRTVFDIPESVAGSCWGAAKPLLVHATAPAAFTAGSGSGSGSGSGGGMDRILLVATIASQDRPAENNHFFSDRRLSLISIHCPPTFSRFFTSFTKKRRKSFVLSFFSKRV